MKLFPHDKHFSSNPAIKISSNPAIKIGRLAVALQYREAGIGSKLMSYIKKF